MGKSTIAHALSAERQIPVLDLSETAVATGSLKGILSDSRNGDNPVEAFHAGDLPIIVDALDEGRLLSSEKGFFSFLETSAETVLDLRSTTDKPKLILLGRARRPWTAAHSQPFRNVISNIPCWKSASSTQEMVRGN